MKLFVAFYDSQDVYSCDELVGVFTSLEKAQSACDVDEWKGDGTWGDAAHKTGVFMIREASLDEVYIELP